MNVVTVFHIVGMNLAFVGISMLLPALWSVYYASSDLFALLLSSLITSLFGLSIYFIFKRKRTEGDIRHKEGYAIVTFTWLLASLFGSLPYILSGSMLSFSDAIFESASGFTTTGSTILTDIEALMPGILFWRSLTHWLGGMGILVLFIAVLSMTGSGGLQIFRAESTSLIDNKLRPKMSETAKILWLTYLLLTSFLTMFLWAGGMTFFDALCHAFSTISTGGFSTKNLSIGYYDSNYIKLVITAFMFFSGINFALYYPVYKNRNLKIIYKNSEFRLYALTIILATSFIFLVLSLFPFDGSIGENILNAAFQATSVITTTGFVSHDYNLWPDSLKLLIFALMFTGGTTGSTSGSIKTGRYLILLKQTALEMKKNLHPKSISKLKIGEKVIEERLILNVMQFFFMFIIIFIFSAIILSFQGIDFITALTASAASITNVGPGFNLAGPMENYSFFSSFNKIYLSFLMLIGRLELFTVLVLFNPVFWKK